MRNNYNRGYHLPVTVPAPFKLSPLSIMYPPPKKKVANPASCHIGGIDPRRAVAFLICGPSIAPRGDLGDGFGILAASLPLGSEKGMHKAKTEASE